MATKIEKHALPKDFIESVHIEALAIDVSLELWQNLFAPDETNVLTAFSTGTLELGCMVSIEFLKKEASQSRIKRSLKPLAEYLEYADTLKYTHVFLKIG